MQEELDRIKLVVALRSARAAVGWSQEELAQRLGIAKTTIARMETLEGGLRADQLAQIVRLYKSVGVSIDFMLGDDVVIRVDPVAQREAQARLQNEELRRSDRKRPIGGLINGTSSEDGAGGGLLNAAAMAKLPGGLISKLATEKDKNNSGLLG